MSFAKEGKYKREKCPLEHHNAQKWANTKRGLASRSLWHMPFKEWMTNISPRGGWWLK